MRVDDITTPPTTDPASIAISPDGQQIASWRRTPVDPGRGCVADSVSARSPPGTEGAAFPF
jgi:hypothetical protein